MQNNILKTLSKNLGFKILAVLFAFTLWLIVYNIEDPTKTKALTINVTVQNKESVDAMGKYYEVIEGTNKVTFSVTAARSILDKLDESDFVAVADMEQLAIEEDGVTGTVPIEITCIANVNSNSVKLSSTTKSMKVTLEDLMSKQFVVVANATGTVAEGYALGAVEVTAPNVLQVSGPKTIVQQIDAVVATIDVTGITDPKTTYRVTPILFDKNGKEIDTTRLTLSDATVNVSAEILNTKEASISVLPSGSPADGYMVTAIKSNPMSIQLKGDKSVLNSINSIQIPSELVSIGGAMEDVTVTIDVSEYIPEGVTLVDSEAANIQITVEIGKMKTKSFSVNTEDIVVTGLENGTSLEFALSSVAVSVTGLEADVNRLENTNIPASLDVTGLGKGTHEVEIILDLDENQYTYDKVKVSITISEETGTDSTEE